jgi:uncharacterized membrane protein YgdD (TMEM256/DUF423 family)
MERFFFAGGAVAAALAVMLGAFGAHALREQLSADLLSTFETGVRYHVYHALALFVVVLALARGYDAGWATLAGWLFMAGILLFSGSLYVLAITGVRWLGAVTPFGGLAFIAGWLALAVAAWRA